MNGSALPRLIGYQVIDVTTHEPSRGETAVLSEAAAIRELLDRRMGNSPDQWAMVAILEGDLDRLVGECGPITFID